METTGGGPDLVGGRRRLFREQTAAHDPFGFVIVGPVQGQSPLGIMGVPPEILRNAKFIENAFAAHQDAERALGNGTAKRIRDRQALIGPEAVEIHRGKPLVGLCFRQQRTRHALMFRTIKKGHGRPFSRRALSMPASPPPDKRKAWTMAQGSR